MNAAEIAQRLEAFLRRSFAIAADDPGFSHQVDLFEAGYVDSVGVTETLAYIGEAFGVEVPDEALLDDRFATIDGMAQTIADLLGRAEAPVPIRKAS